MTTGRGAFVVVCLLGCSCGASKIQPAAPTVSAAAGTSRSVDSTLEIPPPTLISPADNAVVYGGSPFVVTVGNVSGTSATAPPGYELEIVDSAGTSLSRRTFPATTATGATAYTVPDLLKGNQPLTWRVRATSTDGVGPWSATRSVVLRVFTTIGNLPASDALGTAVDVGAVSAPLKAFVQMQGSDVDCTRRAGWRVSNPSVAAISDIGVLTPLRTGNVIVTATCEAAPATRDIQVVPAILSGALSVDAYTLIAGSGSRCWREEFSPGRSRPFTLVITDSGNPSSGRLNLNFPGFLFSVSGTVGSAVSITLDGTSSFREDCTFDIHDFNVRVHIVARRFGFELSEFPLECRPHVAPSAVWTISGRLDNVHR